MIERSVTLLPLTLAALLLSGSCPQLELLENVWEPILQSDRLGIAQRVLPTETAKGPAATFSGNV